MLKFISIQGQGFGSLIHEFYFEFGEPGLKIIKGENGSGKTTMISLIAWVLYGSTLKGKDPATWDHLRPNNWKGTVGRVTFETDSGIYTVVRCKKYKGTVDNAKGGDGLFLFKNKKNITAGEKRDTQKDIIKLLGMSFDLFKNSIMFGQKVKRIINESGPNQAKVFEEAFDADFINEAKKKAELERDEIVSKVKSTESDIGLAWERITSIIEQIRGQESLIENFEKNQNDRISDIKEEIKEDIEKISKLNKKVVPITRQEIEQLKERYRKANKDLLKYNEIQSAINDLSLKRENPNLKTTKNLRVCDKCGQKLDDKQYNKAKKEARKQKLEIENKIKELKGQQPKLIYDEKQVEGLYEAYERAEEDFFNNKSLQKQISEIQQRNKRRSQKVDEIKNEKAPKADLLKLKKKKKTKKEELVKLKEELEKYNSELEVINWCIKEPLSNKGIKAYIFESQLARVNEVLDNYAEFLPFRIEFGVDTDTKSKKFYTLVEVKDGIVEYDDLSGGEQQLVNVAIAFAIHEVVSKDTNVLFMDEVFESLDANNIEIVGDMIINKAEDKEVLLVTHTSFYPTGAEIINFSKTSKGQTKIS